MAVAVCVCVCVCVSLRHDDIKRGPFGVIVISFSLFLLAGQHTVNNTLLVARLPGPCSTPPPFIQPFYCCHIPSYSEEKKKEEQNIDLPTTDKVPSLKEEEEKLFNLMTAPFLLLLLYFLFCFFSF